MLGTNLDYLAQIGPPIIKIEVGPRNKSGGARFFKFAANEYHQMVKR